MNKLWKLYKEVHKVLQIYDIKIIWENGHFLLSSYQKDYGKKILINNSLLKEANLFNPDLIILLPNKHLSFVKLINNSCMQQSYKDKFFYELLKKYDNSFLIWDSVADVINFAKKQLS